jgi:hypothetical protein
MRIEVNVMKGTGKCNHFPSGLLSHVPGYCAVIYALTYEGSRLGEFLSSLHEDNAIPAATSSHNEMAFVAML